MCNDAIDFWLVISSFHGFVPSWDGGCREKCSILVFDITGQCIILLDDELYALILSDFDAISTAHIVRFYLCYTPKQL